MSHIHLPDGVIAPVWWVPAWIVCATLVWLFAKRLKGDEVRRKIPFTGVVGALMLIFMSVPLGFLPVHLSLAVLCGILAGPGLGFIAVFTVNTILALMGHGGFTTIGLNALVMGSEAVLGYYLFKVLSAKWGTAGSAVIANLVTLLLSTALMVVIVASAVGLPQALPIHSHDEDASHLHSDEAEPVGEQDETPANIRFLSLSGWSAAAVIVLAGILIESVVTGLIVRFFSRVRPDLLDAAVQR
ncbi:MAG: energy-coupling factor ABC transporter permease [Caldicoprobacterales bacterium]|jgi:cobalt/nickel transport system permease protein